jgi:hypothetical protein
MTSRLKQKVSNYFDLSEIDLLDIENFFIEVVMYRWGIYKDKYIQLIIYIYITGTGNVNEVITIEDYKKNPFKFDWCLSHFNLEEKKEIFLEFIDDLDKIIPSVDFDPDAISNEIDSLFKNF